MAINIGFKAIPVAVSSTGINAATTTAMQGINSSVDNLQKMFGQYRKMAKVRDQKLTESNTKNMIASMQSQDLNEFNENAHNFSAQALLANPNTRDNIDIGLVTAAHNTKKSELVKKLTDSASTKASLIAKTTNSPTEARQEFVDAYIAGGGSEVEAQQKADTVFTAISGRLQAVSDQRYKQSENSLYASLREGKLDVDEAIESSLINIPKNERAAVQMKLQAAADRMSEFSDEDQLNYDNKEKVIANARIGMIRRQEADLVQFTQQQGDLRFPISPETQNKVTAYKRKSGIGPDTNIEEQVDSRWYQGVVSAIFGIGDGTTQGTAAAEFLSQEMRNLIADGYDIDTAAAVIDQAYQTNYPKHQGNFGSSGVNKQIFQNDLDAIKTKDVSRKQAAEALSALKIAQAKELADFDTKTTEQLFKYQMALRKENRTGKTFDTNQFNLDIGKAKQTTIPSTKQVKNAGKLTIADLKNKPKEPKTPPPNDPSAASFADNKDNKDNKALQVAQQEHLAVAKQIQALREKRDKISALEFKEKISKLHEQSKVIRKKIKNHTKKVPRKTQGEALVENIKKFLATMPDPSKNKSTVNKKELNTVIKQLQSEIN